MMGFKDIVSKIKKSYNDHQEKQRKIAEEDAKLRAKIRSGEIEPIETTLNLEASEKAYASFNCQRMAMVAHTVSTTKRQNVAGRAIAGGLLLGPLGALGGAATAGSKTTDKTTEKNECIDSGTIFFTNKRYIFVGKNNTISIPFEKALEAVISGYRSITIRYPEMFKGEHYILTSSNRSYCSDYHEGIRNLKK